MNISADKNIMRAINDLVDATMNQFWHEGVDAKDEHLDVWRGKPGNKEYIELYKKRAEAALDRVYQRIKEYQEHIDAVIPEDKDGVYALAEQSFKLMNSWDLGTNDFLKLTQKPSPSEFKAQESGDLVYVHPATGSEMSRFMATEWWKSSGSYRHGFVAGYLAALQAKRDKE